MVFWTLYDPERALREWRRVLAPSGRIVVIDALHFASPHTVVQRARRIRERASWITRALLEQGPQRRSPGNRHDGRPAAATIPAAMVALPADGTSFPAPYQRGNGANV